MANKSSKALGTKDWRWGLQWKALRGRRLSQARAFTCLWAVEDDIDQPPGWMSRQRELRKRMNA